MKPKLLRWLGGLLATLLAAIAVVYGLAYWMSEARMARKYAIADPPIALPTDPTSLAHGAHLYLTRGCADCHGEDGSGREVFDAGPVIRVVGPNLTPPALGTRYSDDALAAAIRHGVRHDGTPLVFMPSGDWSELSDADTGALIAHLRRLPPSDHDPGRTEVRPLARVLFLFDAFPLLPADRISHLPRPRVAPAARATASYGAYLAQTCTGCHGPRLAGQRVPGTPPEFPPASDLRPSALAGWKQADFIRAMREGRRPDERELHPLMPWPTLGQMTDTELRALWRYLRELPPAAG